MDTLLTDREAVARLTDQNLLDQARALNARSCALTAALLVYLGEVDISEVEVIAARLAPKPAVPSSIRRLPARKPAASGTGEPTEVSPGRAPEVSPGRATEVSEPSSKATLGTESAVPPGEAADEPPGTPPEVLTLTPSPQPRDRLELNANAVHAMNLGYLFGLKGNQPELLAEAERLLAHLPAGDALAETSERQNGRIVTRRLWLTAEMAGYHDWEHLRTVIRVQSESRYYDGRLDREIENRYFLTNEPYGRFRPAQWLAVIRKHWRVETDCHQTWDVAFEEDDHPWIRATHGLLVTQLLRRIGYNLLVLFRNVSLRSERKALLPWNELYEWLDLALKAAVDHHVEGLRWEDRSAATRV